MIQSQEYTEILIDPAALQEFGGILEEDTCYHSINSQVGVLYVEQKRVPPIQITDSDYAYFPKVYGLMMEGIQMENPLMEQQTEGLPFLFDPLSLIEAGILTAQNPPLNLTGKGVIIGVIDTGIDYQNPVFQTEDGRSRIQGIWDQTITGGNVPEGFLYGSEYTNVQIQEALEKENPEEWVPSRDEIGHGTMVTSVAAGSRLENGRRYIGAAPDSQIAVVKLKQAKSNQRRYYHVEKDVPCYMESDVLQGIQYLQKFAVEYKKPLVIYIGVGTNLGSHGGTGILSDYIRNLSLLKSRVFVIGGGNEGNANHHYEGTYEEGVQTKKIEFRVAEGETGFVMELWGEVPYEFSIVIRSPGGESVRPVFRNTTQSQTYSFVFERTRITIDYLLIEASSGMELIRLAFDAPTEGIWIMEVTKESIMKGGTIHGWLPIKPFLQEDTYFLTAQPKVTLVEPGNTENAITVSAYQAESNGFSITSSRGYTITNKRKPDLAAPGVQVSTIYGKQSGSSLAAAMTAGGVAQFLQWAVIEQNDLFVDSRKVKNYFIRGATRERDLEYPNEEWGYGTLNVAGVFRWIAGF